MLKNTQQILKINKKHISINIIIKNRIPKDNSWKSWKIEQIETSDKHIRTRIMRINLIQSFPIEMSIY